MRKIVLIGLILFLSGCATLFDSGPVTMDVQATGGPAVLMQAWEKSKAKSGARTKEAGNSVFLVRNENPYLGAIINQDNGTQKDVYVYVRKRVKESPEGYEGWNWTLYRGPCEVKTPKDWKKYDGVEAIHFSTPFSQRVTLRVNEGNEIKEIRFDTFGYRGGSTLERINILLIKLPPGEYKFQVFSHQGQGIFKQVKGYPYTRYLNLLNWPDATNERVMDFYVGWKITL